MKSMMNRILLLSVLLIGACTWVEPTDKGVHVRVVYMSQVEGCKSLGKVTVQVLDKIGFIPRSAEQVANELEVFAQNEAAEMGGDSVVALSRVVDGEQVFRVYRCR